MPILRALSTAAALVVLVLGAASASAGGPTSVLIANPTAGASAALYVTDADYTTLQRALEPGDVTSSDPPTLASGPGTAAINVTWLIHDVTVWRVDRILLDAGPHLWVQTTLVGADGIDWTGTGEWHPASDTEAVYEVLDRLDVLPGEPGAGAAAAADGDGTLGETFVQEATSAAPGGGNGGTDTGSVWWLVSGVVAGAVLGAVARPLVADLSARRRFARPRHELIDV